MTLIEVVVIIIVIAGLAMVFLPVIDPPYSRAQKISCNNNLKQLGLAYKIWAGDNNDKYPMDVSVTNGGAMEWMNTSEAWKVFLVMSNELSTPRILLCPADSLRGDAATSFDDDLKNKISYFIGLDATDTNPAALLSGDGNFLLNNSPANRGFVNAATNVTLSWDTSRHVSEVSDGLLFKTKVGCGNIGFCDGSVQSPNNSALPTYLQQTGLTTNRFFIP